MTTHASSRFLLVGPPGWPGASFRESLEAESNGAQAVSYGANALWALGLFDPDVIVISLADEDAGRETARQIRELPTGDMYILVGVNEDDGGTVPEFDLVVRKCACCADLIAELNDLDSTWTVHAGRQSELQAA